MFKTVLVWLSGIEAFPFYTKICLSEDFFRLLRSWLTHCHLVTTELIGFVMKLFTFLIQTPYIGFTATKLKHMLCFGQILIFCQV